MARRHRAGPGGPDGYEADEERGLWWQALWSEGRGVVMDARGTGWKAGFRLSGDWDVVSTPEYASAAARVVLMREEGAI